MVLEFWFGGQEIHFSQMNHSLSAAWLINQDGHQHSCLNNVYHISKTKPHLEILMSRIGFCGAKNFFLATKTQVV